MTGFLDIRTLAFVAGLVSITLAICMVLVAVTRKTYAGFSDWTVGSVANGLGMILMGFRGILPDFVTIVVMNLLLMVALVNLARGLARFTGARNSILLDVSPLVVLLVFVLYFTYVVDDVDLRVVAFSWIGSAVLARGIYIDRRYYTRGEMNRNGFLSVIIILYFGFFLLRGVLTLLYDTDITNLMTAGILQKGSFFAVILWSILITAALISANGQRLERELQNVQEEARSLAGLLPICSHCKKIRTTSGKWQSIESYIAERSHTVFSHSICPECGAKHYPDCVDEETAGPGDEA